MRLVRWRNDRGRSTLQLHLRNAQQLVSLQAQSPLWVFKTVTQGELGIPGAHRVVQGLQEKVAEVKVLEALWLGSCLWEDQLKLVSRAEHQVRSSLGADANPIDAGWGKSRAVGLDGHLKPTVVERRHQRLVELEQGLATRADDKWTGPR